MSGKDSNCNLRKSGFTFPLRLEKVVARIIPFRRICTGCSDASVAPPQMLT